MRYAPKPARADRNARRDRVAAMVRRLVLLAGLLGSLCCVPARADWLQSFAHIACIPDAGALRIEHVAVDGGTFFSDEGIGERNHVKRLKAWEKHGFYDEGRVDQVCRLARATVKVRLRKGEGSERGMCGAAPAAELTLSIDGKAVLNKVTFGDDCGFEPNVRTISMYGGTPARPDPVLSICIGFAPYSPEPNDPMCQDLTGETLLKPIPIDDIKIREFYEASRPH